MDYQPAKSPLISPGRFCEQTGRGKISGQWSVAMVCEKMGTGSGRASQNLDIFNVRPVPVPIFSQE
jgi:hypothetical protein